MIVGHLPAAYLVFRFAKPRVWPQRFLVAGVIGGVFPDIDMIWFHTIGARATHHHDYITHRPIVYLLLLAVALIYGIATGRRPYVVLGLALGALLHTGLDSVAGNIAWAWPFSHHVAPLTVVEATHSHWLLSFMNHWYFQLELVIFMVAAAVFFWTRCQEKQGDIQ